VKRFRESRMSIRFRSAPNLFAQYDGFGNFFHRLALLPALALDAEISLFFGEAKVALQDSFGALDDLAGLQLLR